MNPQTDFGALPSAGLVRRLSAIIYDLLLLAALTIGYALLVFLLRTLPEGMPAQGETFATPPLALQILILGGWWLAMASYFIWCWKKRGQTLAMKTWRLRAQQPNGELLTERQRWLRVVIAPLSLLSGVGLLWCLFDKQHGCLHDRLTGTRVVLLPKKVN